MILEELLPMDYQPPRDHRRLIAAQDRERADKNAETLLAWYVMAFGETVGRLLFEEASRG